MRLAGVAPIAILLLLASSLNGSARAQGISPPPPSKSDHLTSQNEMKPAGKPIRAEPPPKPAPIDPERPPRCVAESREFDAGTVTRGDVIEHAFEIENAGTGPLEIVQVRPACGCTLTRFDRVIEAGKKGKVTLSVSTINFRGPITKLASVRTNDPDLPSFELAIRADVHDIIAVLPSDNIQLGLLYSGQKIEAEITLKATDDRPFSITQIESTDDKLDHDLQMAPDHQSALFRITVPEGRPPGLIAGHFTLMTDHPKVPKIAISCFGTLRDPLAVSPTALRFPTCERELVENHPEDGALLKEISLTYGTGDDLALKIVRCDLPFLKITQQVVEPGKQYRIQAQITSAGLRSGDFSGNIIIATNKKTLVVPVSGKIL